MNYFRGWMALVIAMACLCCLCTEAAAQGKKAEQQVEKLFLTGMTAREGGMNQHAIKAFLEILEIDPSVNRARLELAVAYANIMQYDKAVEQAKIVLEDPETPPNVRTSILAFLAQVEAGQKASGPKSTWRFPVSIAYVYDNNVNIGPSSTIIPGLGELNPNLLPQSDSGLEVSAGISHTLRPGKIIRTPKPFSDAVFLLLSGVTVFDRHYFNEDEYSGDYDLSIISFRTGPALIAPGAWRASLGLQADLLYYGDVTLGQYYTLSPGITWNLNENLELGIDAAIAKRQFSRASETGRDSEYISPRLSLRYVGGANRYALQAAVQYFDENADESRFANSGFGFTLGGALNLTENFVSSLLFRYRKTEYDGTEPGFTAARDEKQHQFTLGFAYTFAETVPTFANWTLGYDVTWTDNRSNIPTTDYERTFYNLSLKRDF